MNKRRRKKALKKQLALEATWPALFRLMRDRMIKERRHIWQMLDEIYAQQMDVPVIRTEPPSADDMLDAIRYTTWGQQLEIARPHNTIIYTPDPV